MYSAVALRVAITHDAFIDVWHVEFTVGSAYLVFGHPHREVLVGTSVASKCVCVLALLLTGRQAS